MEKKKKHSIIWLIIIVLAIATIVMITIAGAQKGERTAYAAETTATTTDDYISTIAGATKTPYGIIASYEVTESSGIVNQSITFMSTQNIPTGTYTVEVAAIGNPMYSNSLSNINISSMAWPSGYTAIIQNTEVTEISYNVQTTTSMPSLIIAWLSNVSQTLSPGNYSLNIQKMKVYSGDHYVYNYTAPTYTEYDTEIEETTYNDGIEEIITYSSSTQETNERNLYFTNTEYNGNTQQLVRAGIKYQNEGNTTNTIEIGYITNQPYNIRMFISTTDSTNEQVYLQDIKTNSNGLTKINIQLENLKTNTDYYIMFQFADYSTPTQANTWWINILNLQINDSSKNLVNYKSYLYDYLNSQFENAENNGYDNGYETGINDGESLYRNNPFQGATLVSAITEENNYTLKNVNINILSNGIDFSSIASAADNYFTSNEIENMRFTVTVNTIPFVFEQNKLYISSDYGFRSLYLVDTNNNQYQMSIDDEQTNIGYAINAIDQTAYGTSIKQIIISFANIDYVGQIKVGQSAAQNSAYQEGYNNGYNNGYQEGYNDATIDGNGPAWSIKKLISTVSAGLNVDLIGEISLGDLLNVALGILLTFAVIRFFGGG